MNVLTSFFHILSSVVNNRNLDWKRFQNFATQDWEQLYQLSKQQGVVSIVFDSLKNIPKEIAPSENVLFRWMQHTLLIERKMKKKEMIAKEFAEELAERNVHVVVLKGLAYASYFPNPYHRESGDLDCYLMGKKEDGDRAVVEMGGVMEEAGNMHSHLCYRGLTIENHALLTSSDKSDFGVKTEQVFQNLIKYGNSPMRDTKLLKPCADFNAMFLVKHAQRHFIKEGIWIRHLLDWAFFLKAESSNVNWEKVIPMMKECKILNFAQVLTALCIGKLGMDVRVEGLKGESKMSDAVLRDILDERPDPYHENLYQKIMRIFRRLFRMWKFRSLAYKNYMGMVVESVVVSSFMSKKI